MSIFPTFLAYFDPKGGIAAVDAMAQPGANGAAALIGQGLKSAWDNLNAAVTANPENQTNIVQAASDMATYEQSKVLQPNIFAPNAATWATFMQNYGTYVSTNIPGASSFLTVVPNGNFASDTDRLTWFTNSLFPKWQAWAVANPGNIDAATIYDGGYH